MNPIPIRGILGKPYIALDEYTDIHGFDQMVPEIWKIIDQENLEKGHYYPISARAKDEQPEFEFMRVREADVWTNKNKAIHCHWMPVAEKLSCLKDFLNTLPFEEVGRVKIFVNAAGSFTKNHRDHNDCYIRSPEEVTHGNEFLWISSHPQRKLHMYDPVENKCIVANSRALFFNEIDLHGSDVFVERNFSLRVDGRFSEELRKKIGLAKSPIY